MTSRPQTPPLSKPEDDQDPMARPPPTTTSLAVPFPTSRKKATGVRPWLLLDSTGQTQVVEAGKHAIMCRTGLPARDLRILDPLLSYPSAVLGRERAIVINLEHIKAIITAQEVLLLNSRDPSVTPFVEELQRRLIFHYHATEAQAEGKQGLENRDGSKILPYEFVALETCLEAACSCLESEAKTLEQEAHPALDKLTSKISTLNLERVRQIKSRLVAITGRVQKVRDELEHLLDDDEDMVELYLTEKLVQQQLDDSSTSSLNEGNDIDDDELQADSDDSIPAEVSLGALASHKDDINNIDNEHDHQFTAPNGLGRYSNTHTSTTRSAISKNLNVGELEMLLEAYFVQIDGTLNKLSTLGEYVDDTEDYINIMLDDKQNQLLQMGVMMTTATLVVTFFVVVAGILGMNIKIALFKEDVQTGMPKFLWTVAGGTSGVIFLYVIAIAWCKHKRLLDN
ncbi:RNA SPLICING PROTEIN MRS2 MITOCHONDRIAL [Salix koriyanagi]|uniref:Magnesium transporter n=1 Tax=Salix koriyanagi TaxID=2511006 RepID=A0A9Q0TRT1_9ROSI|nr:RNA SPLICING PROTEIN MRS2 MITOCHONDRIAL [Salix koriyanagi]